MANTTISQTKDIGIIRVGKEICVDVHFDVDQDVTGASVRLTVPTGVTYSRNSLPKGTYNPVNHVWTIGDVKGSDPVLSGVVCFTITDDTLSPYRFTVTGYADNSCSGCVNGAAVCVTYTGTTCTELGLCLTNTNIYTGNGTLAGNRVVTGGAFTLDFDGTGVMRFGDVSAAGNSTLITVDDANNTITLGRNVRLSSYGTNTITGTPAFYLAVDATGNIIEQPIPGGSGINLYTGDGTLTGNRAVTVGASSLEFNGTGAMLFGDLTTAGNGTTLSINDSTSTITLSNGLTLSSYGAGANTGTPTRSLAVTAGGNVIETAIESPGMVRAITFTGATSYTVLPTDEVIIATGAANPVNVVLPAATTNINTKFVVKVTDVTNPVTVSTAAGTIDTSATYTGLNVPFEVITVVSDGANYHII